MNPKRIVMTALPGRNRVTTGMKCFMNSVRDAASTRASTRPRTPTPYTIAPIQAISEPDVEETEDQRDDVGHAPRIADPPKKLLRGRAQPHIPAATSRLHVPPRRGDRGGGPGRFRHRARALREADRVRLVARSRRDLSGARPLSRETRSIGGRGRVAAPGRA